MVALTAITRSEYDEIAEFLSVFNNRAESFRFWRKRMVFWWDNNPAFSEELDRGWVLKENGNVVGFIGAVPTFFKYGDKTIKVFSATTWRVLPKHRQHSLKLFYRLLVLANKSILFDTTPTDHVVKIIEALRFHKIFSAPFYEYIIDFSTDKPKLASQNDGLYQAKQVVSCDEAFDVLWERDKNKYKNTNVRDMNSLNWYCFGEPEIKKILLGCFADGKLESYAICMPSIIPDDNSLLCCDLWGGLENQSIIKSIVNAAIKYARDNKYDRLFFPVYCKAIEGINVNNIYRMRACEPKYYYKTRLHDINVSNSYFVYLQGDVGMF